MKNYNCRKCGSIDLFIKSNGSQVGLYCSDCGAWQKWLSKDEQRLVEQWIEHVKQEKQESIPSISISNIGTPVINGGGLTMREMSKDSIPWNQSVEEIQATTRDKFKSLEEAVKPLISFLNDNYDPHTIAIVTEGRVDIYRGDMGMPLEVRD